MHPATGWVMRGVRRRHENPEEAARLKELDQALSQRRSEEHSIHVPGTFRATGYETRIMSSGQDQRVKLCHVEHEMQRPEPKDIA